MSKTYQIGQVLYIISVSTQKVIPVQVQEIHKKQTIEGEEIVYMVMDPNETGPHDLASIDGDIYSNPKEVSQFLKNAAGTAIDKMVDFAVSVASDKFGVQEQSVFKAKTKSKTPPPPPQQMQIPTQKSGGMSRDSHEIEGDMLEGIGPDGNPQKVKIRSVQMPGEAPKAV